MYIFFLLLFVFFFSDIPIDTNVTAIACTDEDLGPNGNFSFEIVSGNFGKKFRLDDNRVVVNDRLDHENEHEYSLEIHVTDHGVPNNVAVVMVTLYVKAKNEFAPVFQHSNYTVNISEATAIGKYIREFSFSKFHGRIAPLSIGLRENKNLPSEKITTLNY